MSQHGLTFSQNRKANKRLHIFISAEYKQNLVILVCFRLSSVKFHQKDDCTANSKIIQRSGTLLMDLLSGQSSCVRFFSKSQKFLYAQLYIAEVTLCTHFY